MAKQLSYYRSLLPTILFTLTLYACTTPSQDITLAIKDINIIDPLNKKIIPHQTIHIKDSVVIAIVDARDTQEYPHGTLILEGQNKYAISGFWNMHTHVCWKDNLNQTLFPVLLSYGIIGIRDMGGDAAILNKLKKQVHQDPTSGPVMFGAGPLLDGEHPVHPAFSVALTEENLDAVLDSLYKKNVDFLKVYSLLPKPLVERIATWCAQKQIPFAGHISEYLTPLEAAQLHQKSFEHLNRIEDLRQDTTALDAFIAAAKENQNWFCPTLLTYKRKVDIAQKTDLYDPLLEILDDDLKAEWQQRQSKREKAASTPQELEQLASTYAAQAALVHYLYQQKLPMLIGSDFGGMPYVYPGLGIHQEMELLSSIGFDNYDILKMATYNPALYFNVNNQYGTIAKGKLANLVLLNANPVTDIRHTTQIGAVIRNGKKVKMNNK